MLSDTSKPRIREAIVVEGRYDKAALSNAVEANIIELGGFRIYNDPELLELIRRLADACGVIVLTDSDRAGFRLRGYLKGSVGGTVKHAYIPDVYGKERRKAAPSKEGKLGVEGMRVQTLREAILNAGATVDIPRRFAPPPSEEGGTSNYPLQQSPLLQKGVPSDSEAGDARPITYADFYELGLAGGANSAEKRRELARRLQLPERLSADSLISVLNALGVTLSDLQTDPE